MSLNFRSAWLRSPVAWSCLLAGILGAVGSTALPAGEIGFLEDFSLATDRAVPLKQLIPGTEDYYYYHCLHFQNGEQFAKVDELLAPWIQRHGETGRVWEVRMRQALLTYEKNPPKSLEYLRGRLGLQFNHQKEELGVEPNLPVTLDQTLFARQKLFERAAPHVEDLNPFEDSALEWLVTEKLHPSRRRQLLQRLTRPDYPQLAQLVVEDLNHPNSPGFGTFPIHRQLLKSQLDECLKLKPDLLNQMNFVQTYLTKLQPGPDEDWRHDPQVLASYLDRLWAFVQQLAPAHNSLKAHVLYHRLVLDRQRGVYDKERFLAYLQLPRHVPYMAPKFLERDESRRFPVDLNADFTPFTLLSPVGNDEPLVRSYLQHFLTDAAGYKEFETLVNDVYLKHLFAETKIVQGLGEPEQWAALLPPELFQQLKERVDIDFAFTNQTSFKTEEPVRLDLHVKNVGTLIVKVFEINTTNYYRQHLQEVNTDISLDGLVANEEQTHKYPEPPLRRVTRRFEFAKLNKPGVYVIDFIGNGRSSRALIRKGKLRHVVRTGPAGQVFTILDDQNKLVTDATLWLAGHEYSPDKDGTITVPFSTAPSRQPIVIQRGDFASLDHFQHEGESYSLAAGIYVDREALLTRKKAQVVVRPGLFLGGTPVTLSLLEEVQLLVTSTDLDGVATSQEIPNFPLFEDRETVHEFQVPARLASIAFTLRGKVKNLSAGGQKVDLAASAAFALNEIDKTEKVEDLHLARFGDDFVLELLGKTGEAKASRPVQVVLKHRDFKEPVHVTLKSNPRGRVTLGPLLDIVSVTATGPENTARTWVLPADRHTYPQSLHGRVGETLTLPFLPRRIAAKNGEDVPAADEVSLLELRGEVYVADRRAHVSIQDGLLQIQKLPAGDYDLLLKSSGARVRIRVVAGELQNGYVLGQQRQLETKPLAPIQIEKIEANAEQLTIRLQNVSKFTRVHVFGTRYVPAYNAFDHLSAVRSAEPYVFLPGRAESLYLTGRNIGDEYRYIIDRKYAKKFPGNTLERPSLLLNPWAVRSTETGEQVAAAGDAFAPNAPPPPSKSERGDQQAAQGAGGPGNSADLDFLAQSTAVLVNLTPDKDGVITIKREALGSHQYLHVVAVDPLNTTFRSVALPEAKTDFIDLRLQAGLDPKQHYTQQKQISVVPAGRPFVLADITTSKFEAYDSLARVYALFTTLTHDPKLAEFSFLMNWPKLKPEEKRAHYSKYASHELTFFLAKKDPKFFLQVILPYLANKKDKTFVDQWLLSEAQPDPEAARRRGLNEYLQPWKHGQLNMVERILLAQRIAGERPNTARHVTEQFELLPPNIDQFIRLFDTAVKGSALDTDDALGIRAASGKEITALGLQLKMLNADVGAKDAPAPSPAVAGARPAAPAPEGLRKHILSLDKLAESKSEKAKQFAPARDGKARRSGGLSNEADRNANGADEFYGFSLKRQEMRQLYRKLDKTMEWAENNYHHLTIDQQTAALITVNAFWRDYAQHDPAQPFYSRNLAEAARNFPEMLLALAVLDLPFESPKAPPAVEKPQEGAEKPAEKPADPPKVAAKAHETKFDGIKMTLTPGGPMIIYHEEIRPAKQAATPVPILVSQNFFRHGDRQRMENGEPVDKYVAEEFVIHTVYGCQVVVTNPTSARQKLSVLLQIPQGSIPVLNGQFTRTVHLNLEPYHTQTIDYHFYFPAPGKFAHYPVHVAKNEELITFAQPFPFNVVDKPTKIDTGSWDYISQHGSVEDVVKFLGTHNISQLNLEKIAFRMRDAETFKTITNLLAQRHVYHHTLWSYALLHNVVPAAHEFLQHADQVINEAGGRLASSLLTIDPVARRTFEHLEYKPLVNARAHSLGKRRQILNDRFFEQYHRFLKQLGYERQLDSDDWLAVTYYLLLQDRVEEALATFGRVNSNQVATKMQYDYCAAYLDFFTGEVAPARAIAARYAEHPVDRWRQTFTAITAQLDEIEGKATKTVDAEDRGQQQTQLAATEPSFDFQVEAHQLTINFQNLESVKVNYYLMDVELLFSRNPFVQQFSGQFSSIQPNHSETIQLQPAADKKDAKDAPRAKSGTMQVPLPAALHNKNVLVEITAGGETKTQAYYSHSLALQVIENYGQVRVTHAQSAKPIAKAYVKVYAQFQDGNVRFYKDGYTDLRGRFDYSSLNTNELDLVQKFSLLIMSEDHGAVVREANPPKR